MFCYFIRSSHGKYKNQRDDQKRKMEKSKARKELNIELFIVE